MSLYWDTVAPWAEQWARWMLLMSVQVTVFAGLIWGITRLLPRASASLRHLLWLLVFVKLLLPPTLSSPWSAASLAHRVAPVELPSIAIVEPKEATEIAPAEAPESSPVIVFRSHIPVVAMSIWLLGVVAFGASITLQTRRYGRRVAGGLTPAPPEVIALARELGERLDVRRSFRVCVSSELRIAALMGYRRPVIILPQSLVGDLSRAELSDVIGHELAHIKRNDIPVGWLTSFALGLYWFHPAVWIANFYLRREREMASDDLVLHATRQDGHQYASTIIRMAEKFDQTAPAGVGFLGILEIADDLLHRVRSAADGTRRRRMGRGSALAVAILAILLLPMAVWTPATLAADIPPAAATGSAASPATRVIPEIVSSDPANGATAVDPAKKVIQVKFNADMAKGFSWTGGPPLFPETTGKPAWVDARTCELPVKLEAGKVYRLGINSKSHRNFRSAEGEPVRPQVIAFVTKGGDPALADALKPPKVVSMNPVAGAKGVASSLDKLVVTFDKAMGDGFSWTGGGDNYPETSGPPSWSDDHKVCTLPVKLKPEWKYRVGLNSPSHVNFQSAYGIPLEPVEWTFTTGK